MPKAKPTYPRRRSSEVRSLRVDLENGDVVWEFRGTRFQIPISYRLLSTSPGTTMGPLAPPMFEEAAREHAVAIVLELDAVDAPEFDDEAVAALLGSLGEFRADEWNPPGSGRPALTLQAADELAIGFVEVSEFQYGGGVDGGWIDDVADRLDYVEGNQARCAGARAVIALAEMESEWVTGLMPFETGCVHYYRHVHTHPAFRGQGVATRMLAYALANLPHRRDHTTSILAAMPGVERGDGVAVGTSGGEKDTPDVDRLAKLYARVGFREIPGLRGDEGEAAVMAHNTEWGLAWSEGRFSPPLPEPGVQAAPRASRRGGR